MGGTMQHINAFPDKLQAARTRFLNAMLYVFMAFCVPIVILLGIRAHAVGWQNSTSFQFLICVLIMGLTLSERWLSFRVRAYSFIVIGFAQVICAALAFGLPSACWVLTMLVASVAALLFGTRTGIVVLATILAVLWGIGLGFHAGWISLDYDMEAFSAATSNWMVFLSITAAFSFMIIAGIGTMHGVMSQSIRDMVDRSAKLHESEEKYRTVLESSPDPIVVYDMEGKVLYFNPVFERVFGWTLSQRMGKKMDDFVPEQCWPETKEMIECMKAEKGFQDFKTLRHTRDGRLVHVNLSGAVYCNSDGESIGSVISLQDVTARKQMEDALNQSEKMATIGALSAGIAHELRNPIAAITHTTQNVRNRLTQDMPKNVKAADKCGVSMDQIRAFLKLRDIDQMVEGVFESCARASKIVDNTLAYSRIIKSQYLEHDLETLLKNTLELAQFDLNFKRVSDIIFDSDPVPLVLCQEDKIQQVILNILKNGAQAMADRAKGSGREYKSKFGIKIFKTSDNMACIEIRDNGPGIKDCEKIFELFYTTRKQSGGIGLGLFICRQIIDKEHKGSLKAESFPGQGAKFIIKLPFQQ